MEEHIVVFGATSAIANAYLRKKAVEGHKLTLVARNKDKLDEVASDLRSRGASSVRAYELDMLDTESYENIIQSIFSQEVNIVLVAFGTLPDQKRCFEDISYAIKHINLNALATVSVCTLVAQKLKNLQNVTLAVITSVAGDRGKKSNYFYGASKAFVSTFLAGLRNDLYDSGVHVVDLKLGFVDTPMTQNFPKGFLWTSAEKVAHGIDNAIRSKKDIAYVPFFWRWIMFVIKMIPERIFKRMSM
ncbi:MAG: SDR family oxidoreductase [Deltaproteobacteria bacterium]|nr:SDR family oxidoreductase [Deltaproteobacteria bacterium]